jgi:hypothetical protein
MSLICIVPANARRGNANKGFGPGANRIGMPSHLVLNHAGFGLSS